MTYDLSVPVTLISLAATDDWSTPDSTDTESSRFSSRVSSFDAVDMQPSSLAPATLAEIRSRSGRARPRRNSTPGAPTSPLLSPLQSFERSSTVHVSEMAALVKTPEPIRRAGLQRLPSDGVRVGFDGSTNMELVGHRLNPVPCTGPCEHPECNGVKQTSPSLSDISVYSQSRGSPSETDQTQQLNSALLKLRLEASASETTSYSQAPAGILLDYDLIPDSPTGTLSTSSLASGDTVRADRRDTATRLIASHADPSSVSLMSDDTVVGSPKGSGFLSDLRPDRGSSVSMGRQTSGGSGSDTSPRRNSPLNTDSSTRRDFPQKARPSRLSESSAVPSVLLSAKDMHGVEDVETPPTTPQQPKRRSDSSV